MPMYDYECQGCKHVFETFQSMRDDALKTCPVCKADKLVRLITGGLASFVSTPRTLGALAERNAKNMSSELKERKSKQQKTRRDEVLYEQLPKGMQRLEKPAGYKPPWYKQNQTASTKKINKMNDRQKTKYIRTGEVA